MASQDLFHHRKAFSKVTVQRGQFITIEGQDGAGKSTNVSVIESWLEKQKITYVQTREPGGTPFGETIRELILNSDDTLFGDKAELLLMFAARAQHIHEVIEPALAAGKWVLCDRFTDATYAYQGGGRGVRMEDISQLENNVQGELRPDLTLLLDLPVETGESRTGLRDNTSEKDRFEQQQLDFKQRVRDTYLILAVEHPNRIQVIDASQSISDVKSAVELVLSNFISDLK